MTDEGDITEKQRAGYVGEGRFNSPLPDYPGYMTLPYPFMDSHYRAWLKASRDKTGDQVDDLPHFAEWRGAVELVEEWAVDGVPRAALKGDGNVPTVVSNWVRTCFTLYLIEQFDPKAWRGPSAT